MAALLLTVMAVGGIVYAIVDYVQQREPAEWGTYTQTSVTNCRTTRHGQECDSAGVWVSDDGKDAIPDATLNGTVAASGRVRAAYRPGTLEDDGATVETAPDIAKAPVGDLEITALAGGMAACVWWQIRRGRSIF